MVKSEATKALEYVVTNGSNRATYQSEKGVGLNAGATYVNRRIESGALARTVEAVAGGKLQWEAAESVLIVKGNKGHTARVCYVSKCKGFVRCIGLMGGTGVLALDIMGNEAESGGAVELVTMQELAKRIKGNALVTFTRSKDKAQFTGRTIGTTLALDVVGMVYADKGGRVHFIDVETDKSNVYNVEVRGFIGGEDKEAAGRVDEALKALASGGERKAATAKKAATAAKKKK